MDVKSVSAIQRYTDSRVATEPTPGEADATQFLGKTAIDFAETLARSEELSKAAMVGDADPHALVQALAQTELAVEAAVTVRNKVVEAYQEILRMPV
jgi:flagellar hook-basal body complex protein FliE